MLWLNIQFCGYILFMTTQNLFSNDNFEQDGDLTKFPHRF